MLAFRVYLCFLNGTLESVKTILCRGEPKTGRQSAARKCYGPLQKEGETQCVGGDETETLFRRNSTNLRANSKILGSNYSCGQEETLAMSFVIFCRRTRKLWWKQNLILFFGSKTSNRRNSVNLQAFSLIFGAKLA